MHARGSVFDKRRSEAVEAAELPPLLEPLVPPPPFEIVGPLSAVTCPAAKTLLTNLIQNLVATGRATDHTT